MSLQGQNERHKDLIYEIRKTEKLQNLILKVDALVAACHFAIHLLGSSSSNFSLFFFFHIFFSWHFWFFCEIISSLASFIDHHASQLWSKNEIQTLCVSPFFFFFCCFNRLIYLLHTFVQNKKVTNKSQLLWHLYCQQMISIGFQWYLMKNNIFFIIIFFLEIFKSCFYFSSFFFL